MWTFVSISSQDHGQVQAEPLDVLPAAAEERPGLHTPEQVGGVPGSEHGDPHPGGAAARIRQHRHQLREESVPRLLDCGQERDRHLHREDRRQDHKPSRQLQRRHPRRYVDTVETSASKESLRRFTIMEKTLLKAPTRAFTFKTLC